MDDLPLIQPDEIKKERNSKSKDKKDKQSWDDNLMRKEKRAGRKRVSAIINLIFIIFIFAYFVGSYLTHAHFCFRQTSKTSVARSSKRNA